MAARTIFTVDLRIGFSVENVISNTTKRLHRSVAEVLLRREDTPPEIEYLGDSTECAVTWSAFFFKRDLIHEKFLERLDSLSVDLLLVDTSSSPLSQSPIFLSNCLSAIVEATSKGLCKSAVILTSDPFINGEEALKRSAEHNPLLDIAIIGQNSNPIWTRPFILPALLSEAGNILDSHLLAHTLSPADLLSKKCIRRHGHFNNHRTLAGETYCSDTSYLLRDCQGELFDLIKAKISELPEQSKIKYIIYDCEGSQDLAQACAAAAIHFDMKSERYASVIKDQQLCGSLDGMGILVVDFVASGKRAKSCLQALSSSGLWMSTDAIAAVGPSKVIHLDRALHNQEVKVHTLVMKGQHKEHRQSECPQCRLALSVSDAVAEDDKEIDAYTMHKLVMQAGWEPEPPTEVPNGRAPLPMIPKFDPLLEVAGDWLCYKLRRRIDSIVKDEANDPLIIYLNERDAGRIVSLIMESRKKRFSTLEIPKRAVDSIGLETGWSEFLKHPPADHRHWVDALADSTADGILLIDNFRVTSSTLNKLTSLLSAMKKRYLGTVALIDFDPLSNFEIDSLYDWTYSG